MKRNYKIYAFPIVCDDDTISWGAQFEKFPGCGGGGDTPDEAIREAFENLELHIEAMQKEGLQIPPEDSNTNELTGYSGKVAFRMSKTLHKEAIRFAQNEGISLNAFINEALSYRLGQVTSKSLQATKKKGT